MRKFLYGMTLLLKNLIKCFLVTLLLIGCNQKQELIHHGAESELTYIKMVNRNTSSKQKLESYLKNISYKALETHENSLLAKPDKVFLIQDKFYIVDSKRSAVKAFDDQGNYLFDIGTIGKGPGEFLNISDVQLNYDKNSFLIFSNRSRAIYIFDLNGKFLNRKPVKFFGSRFCLLPDNEMAFYVNYNVSSDIGPYNLLITNDEIDVKEKHFYFGEDEIYSFDFTGFLTSGSSSCIYASAFSDTIYQIKNKEVTPKYIYDFGGNSITIEDIKKNGIMALNENPSHLGSKILETDEALLFDYAHEGKDRFAVYMKSTKDLLIEDTLEKSYLSNIFFTPIGISDDNRLISLLSVDRVLYHIEKDANFLEEVRQNDSILYDIIKDLKGLENPVLMMYNIK